ncbi:Putative auto-transporter adhesin, head GIN domain [Nonlabens sp. Hel1_33_55]|uniref:head GIN domain-containing protein n=1 Tax=Nonlabens sp. Hel1_33_55 TaxID=1336802 RepID=UPI000875DA6D|nr:head GIN domain-containing protein [Nonlabens sp. Hel1_33_55]SCY06545.1 Putative auto-transporter adhesin, head GIN domain [Nonlabens sp. Hel1_33_55]
MKKIILVAIAIVAFQSANAQWFGNKKVNGNGDVITQNFRTSNYDGVSMAGSMDVELISGKEGNIKVEAESNLMEYLEIEVKGNRLTIGIEDGINLNSRKGIKVYVPVEQIDYVSLAGSGDITSDLTLKSEKMKISVAGSGDIKLRTESKNLSLAVAGSGDLKVSGRTENLDASVAGSGDISAYDLKANNVNASIAGSGDVAVFCNGGKMNASIIGSGDLRYKGKTSDIKKTVMGSGDITQM